MKNEDSITLHPKFGLNPRLTICTNCGKDGRYILLLGIKNEVGTCLVHGNVITNGSICPFCKNRLENQRELRYSEKIPSGLCEACEKEVNEYVAIVASGGVYFKCVECRHTGVVRPSEFATHVREVAKIPTGPVGVEFQHCSEHSVHE